jgi:hypothetical protein
MDHGPRHRPMASLAVAGMLAVDLPGYRCVTTIYLEQLRPYLSYRRARLMRAAIAGGSSVISWLSRRHAMIKEQGHHKQKARYD